MTIAVVSELHGGGFSTSTGQRSDQYWSRHEPLLVRALTSSGGVLKKVDSGTGKLGYGFTDSVH